MSYNRKKVNGDLQDKLLKIQRRIMKNGVLTESRI